MAAIDATLERQRQPLTTAERPLSQAERGLGRTRRDCTDGDGPPSSRQRVLDRLDEDLQYIVCLFIHGYTTVIDTITGRWHCPARLTFAAQENYAYLRRAHAEQRRAIDHARREEGLAPEPPRQHRWPLPQRWQRPYFTGAYDRTSLADFLYLSLQRQQHVQGWAGPHRQNE